MILGYHELDCIVSRKSCELVILGHLTALIIGFKDFQVEIRLKEQLDMVINFAEQMQNG